MYLHSLTRALIKGLNINIGIHRTIFIHVVTVYSSSMVVWMLADALLCGLGVQAYVPMFVANLGLGGGLPR